VEFVTLWQASFSRNWILVSFCHGEALRLAKDRMNEKNVYFMNPSFDK